MSDIVPTNPEMPSLLNFVAQAVSDPNIDVAKLEALLRMQREIVADDARVQFNAALHAAQAEMPRVKKNGTIDMGSKGSMRFATWEDVDTALRPILDRHQFSLSFDTQQRDGGGSVIVGTLQHVAGHSRIASFSLPLDSGAGRNNLQAAGSTLSYGRRYIAEMLFNIVREGADDDGKRGGTKFISDVQANELRALAKDAGRQEGAFLDRLFAGAVRSFDEVEDGNGYYAAKSTLEAIIHQRSQKAGG